MLGPAARRDQPHADRRGPLRLVRRAGGYHEGHLDALVVVIVFYLNQEPIGVFIQFSHDLVPIEILQLRRIARPQRQAPFHESQWYIDTYFALAGAHVGHPYAQPALIAGGLGR